MARELHCEILPRLLLAVQYGHRHFELASTVRANRNHRHRSYPLRHAECGFSRHVFDPLRTRRSQAFSSR